MGKAKVFVNDEFAGILVEKNDGLASDIYRVILIISYLYLNAFLNDIMIDSQLEFCVILL